MTVGPSGTLVIERAQRARHPHDLGIRTTLGLDNRSPPNHSGWITRVRSTTSGGITGALLVGSRDLRADLTTFERITRRGRITRPSGEPRITTFGRITRPSGGSRITRTAVCPSPQCSAAEPPERTTHMDPTPSVARRSRSYDPQANIVVDVVDRADPPGGTGTRREPPVGGFARRRCGTDFPHRVCRARHVERSEPVDGPGRSVRPQRVTAARRRGEL